MVESNAPKQLLLDLRQNTVKIFLKLVTEMLARALGNRVHEIAYVIEPCAVCWPVGKKMPTRAEVSIGLKVNPEHAYDIINRGPTANLPEVRH